MSFGTLAAGDLLTDPAGSAARGRSLVDGIYPHYGDNHPIPGHNIWRLAEDNDQLRQHIHRFDWLDDLRMEGGKRAILLAQRWLFEWISRYPEERRFPLTQQVAGHRIIRWLHNCRMLLAMQDAGNQENFARSVELHASFLRRRRRVAGKGLPRIEVLAGRLCAELASGMGASEIGGSASELVNAGRAALADHDGIASRNPEELFRILQNLECAAAALDTAGLSPRSGLKDTIELAGGILSSLRHVNGDLPRFHGGGCLPAGLANRVIARFGTPGSPGAGPVMGYCRMRAGGTSVMLDIAPPPTGPESGYAHASTLAIEIVTAKCPIVVNRGPGIGFEPETGFAARSTAAHSTVEINETSSARLAPPTFSTQHPGRALTVAPDDVRVDQLPGRDGLTVIASHNGYVQSFGLTHMRRFDMRRDGTRLWAEDTFWTRTGPDRNSHPDPEPEAASARHRLAARFHLHPDVSPRKVFGNRSAEIALAGGELWRFRFEGPARMEIEESSYLDEATHQVRPSSQIVLHSETKKGAAQLRWEFARIRGRQT